MEGAMTQLTLPLEWEATWFDLGQPMPLQSAARGKNMFLVLTDESVVGIYHSIQDAEEKRRSIVSGIFAVLDGDDNHLFDYWWQTQDGEDRRLAREEHCRRQASLVGVVEV
jgi:hypothetical protein